MCRNGSVSHSSAVFLSGSVSSFPICFYSQLSHTLFGHYREHALTGTLIPLSPPKKSEGITVFRIVPPVFHSNSPFHLFLVLQVTFILQLSTIPLQVPLRLVGSLSSPVICSRTRSCILRHNGLFFSFLSVGCLISTAASWSGCIMLPDALARQAPGPCMCLVRGFILTMVLSLCRKSGSEDLTGQAAVNAR